MDGRSALLEQLAASHGGAHSREVRFYRAGVIELLLTEPVDVPGRGWRPEFWWANAV